SHVSVYPVRPAARSAAVLPAFRRAAPADFGARPRLAVRHLAAARAGAGERRRPGALWPSAALADRIVPSGTEPASTALPRGGWLLRRAWHSLLLCPRHLR